MTSANTPPLSFFKSTASAVLFLFVLAGCGASSGTKQINLSGPTMGTGYNVAVIAPPDAPDPQAIQAAIDDALNSVDDLMSTYKDTSELSRFNASSADAPFSLSKDTAAVFACALEVSRQTAGAFDVTVGPLVNAWGFGPPEKRAALDEATLDEIRKDVGYQHLHFDAQAATLAKARPGVYCDLSAIAKGYAADRVAWALDAMRLTRYMVEVGGEVRTRGRNTDDVPWRIAIERPDPETRSVLRVVPLEDLSMATSGDYRNFYIEEGRRLSHTIDPRTGRPAAHSLASVSVVHKDCMWADAYATAIMVLGPEEGYAFAEKQGLAACFVLHDGEAEFTERETPAFTALAASP